MPGAPDSSPFLPGETPEDVRSILADLRDAIDRTFGKRLMALYLTESLTYGGFDSGSSDIDYLAVLTEPITDRDRSQLIAAHADIFDRHPVWRERIEGSFITRAMLDSVLPPECGRPYVNGGRFWDPDPPYGNEWLINLYAIERAGIPLIGPRVPELIPPVRIEDVRAANRRDLFEERLPTIDDPSALPDGHHEAYVTLTLCRTLHRELNDEVVSKRVAARWVIDRYGERWRPLIEAALAWQHGDEPGLRSEVIAFARFAGDALEETKRKVDSVD